MKSMKDGAILCNIGHFDTEIQMARLNSMPGFKKKSNHKLTSILSLTANRSLSLAEGRLVNLGCATGHPSFVRNVKLSQPGH